MTKQQWKHNFSRYLGQAYKKAKRAFDKVKADHNCGYLVKGHPSWNITSCRKMWYLENLGEHVRKDLCWKCRWNVPLSGEFRCNHEEGYCYGERFEQSEP